METKKTPLKTSAKLAKTSKRSQKKKIPFSKTLKIRDHYHKKNI